MVLLASYGAFGGGSIGNILAQWEAAGIFTYALPFLLIFAIVYAILTNVNVFKDNKAVNIEKLRQLEMNIHEDLEREEIDQPAKAVLFGNAYRLDPPNDRAATFTDKCISAAERSSTALICTPDLFLVARHLSNKKKDARFATRCRKAIFKSVGVVVFPEIPEPELVSNIDVAESET